MTHLVLTNRDDPGTPYHAEIGIPKGLQKKAFSEWGIPKMAFLRHFFLLGLYRPNRNVQNALTNKKGLLFRLNVHKKLFTLA